MLTEIEEAFARLTMLEFMLEVVMANQLSEAPPKDSEIAKSDLLRISTRTYGHITGDLDAARNMRNVSERASEMAARFVEKVARREAEIRGVLSSGLR